ncbi:MAG: creatininase family protein [Chloroflexi bacterium]|nr:creatininase family protein [Chloroflexota bacterium]
MPVNKYLMGQMTWPELREAVAEGRLAVLPAGCIEQHGPQLPLDTDIFLADEISRRAGALVPDKVVIVPPIVHGHSPHHMDFPGTLTADPQHMINYVLDVTLSLASHGFKKILIVNGHGSNAPVLDLVARQTILRTEGKTACASLFYMNSAEYEKVANDLFPEMAGRWGHADSIETSLYMGLRPDLVQLEKAKDDPVTDLMMLGTALLPLRIHWSSLSQEGIYGLVSSSSQEKGEKLVAAAVEGLAKVYQQFYDKVLPPRVDHH